MAQSHGKFRLLSNIFSYFPALGNNLHSFISAWKRSRLHLRFKPTGNKTHAAGQVMEQSRFSVFLSARRWIWRALQLSLSLVHHSKGGTIPNAVTVSIDCITLLSSVDLEVLISLGLCSLTAVIYWFSHYIVKALN